MEVTQEYVPMCSATASPSLDELEEFLRQVESQGPAEIAKINERPPENIVKLLRDVNNELAEAQREVLQLRDENMALKEDCSKYSDKEHERDQQISELRTCIDENTGFTTELTDEFNRLGHECRDLRERAMNEKAGMGPAKRGSLSMGAKKLDCELIGGQTLELSDTSQPGHCHVSKISLSHILEVKTVDNPRDSFCVTTEGGSYIMTASSSSEAKSWVRSVQVSVKVAKARSQRT